MMKAKASLVRFSAMLLVVLAACVPNSIVQVGKTPAPGTQAGTPAPGGQINVPGLSIQVYVPGPNPLVNTPDGHGRPAGFWLGLWHGLIAPVTFIISLFSQTVEMYEVHNNGGWYNFGFLLG